MNSEQVKHLDQATRELECITHDQMGLGYQCILDCVKKALASIEKARAALSTEAQPELAGDGWISCSDRLPDYMPGRDESPVVFGVCNGKIGLYQRQFVGEGWLWAQANGYCAGDLEKTECEADDDYQVTHWRPMLSLPIGVYHAKG